MNAIKHTLRSARSTSILGGGSLSLVGLVVAQGLQLGFLLVLSNFLGADLAGVYVLAIATFGLSSMLSLVGLNWAVIRLSAVDEPDAANAVQRTAASVVLPMSVLVATLVFITAPQLASALGDLRVSPLLRILAPVIPLQALMRLLNSASQARKQMAPTVATERMLQPGLLLAVFCVTMLFVNDVRMAAASFAISILVSFLLSLRFSLSFVDFKRVASAPFQSSAIKFAAPLALMNVVQFAGLQIESISLGILGTTAQVGVYYLALRLTTFCSIILLAANAIFAPYASQLDAQGDMVELGNEFRKVSQSVLGLSVALLGSLFFASDLVPRIAGDGFETAPDLIKILLLGQLASLIAGPAGLTLTMIGRSHINLINSISTLVIQIGLAAILIPRFGIIGAAVGAVVASAAINSLRLAQLRHFTGIRPLNVRNFRIVAVAAIAFLISWLARSVGPEAPSLLRTMGLISLFITTYVGALWFKVLDATDRAGALGALARGRNLITK